MLTEALLQDQIQKQFRLIGWMAEHLSPPNTPGFQDILASRDQFSLRIEVKDFEKVGPGVKIARLFTEYQPSYFIKCLEAGIHTFVAGLLGKEVYFCEVNDRQIVLDIFKLTRAEWIHKHASAYEVGEWVSEVVRNAGI